MREQENKTLILLFPLLLFSLNQMNSQSFAIPFQGSAANHEQLSSSAIKVEAVNAHDVILTHPSISDRPEQVLESQISKPIGSFRPVLLSDLLNRPVQETDWLVDNLFAAGTSNLLIGKAKKGKSSLVRQLAYAVDQGQPFLGRKTKKGRVLYLALEDAENELANRFRLLGAGPGMSIEVHLGTASQSKSDFLAYVRRTRPSLVIIDTLMTYGGLRKWNDFSAAHEAIRPLHALARESGACVVIVHHAKKNGSDDALDEICGSSALGASVDSIFNLKESKGVRTLISAGQRYAVKLEDTVLAFDEATGAFSVAGIRAELEREAQLSRLEALERAMVDHVANNPGCTRDDIFGSTVGSGTNKSKVFRQLIESGCMASRTKGVAGHPLRFELAIPTEGAPVTPMQ